MIALASPLDWVAPVGALALAAVYAWQVSRVWERLGPGRVVPAWRAVAFELGVAVVALAPASPRDGVAHRSLAGHMVQHVLLMMVAGPLLAVGRAGEVLSRALPGQARRTAVR